MRTLFFLMIITFAGGCGAAHQADLSRQVKVAGETADYPQMTQDSKGRIIAWWMEENGQTGEPMVYFSKSSGSSTDFESKHQIAVTRNLNASAGHIPELVIKPNGTYVLVFARRNKASDAPFAGSVLYTQSFDEGKTWTLPEPIHSDTNPDNSHSFHDAILLPNGEVGAVWLDGRHHQVHSTIYFAQTRGDEGFGKDYKIAGPSCQCCKLDMYVDDNENTHFVYRSLSEDNIRDIKHVVSTNNGKSFSEPVLVSDDNWQIGACPHNGPSVTKTNGGLYSIWYTQGGGKGLYFARSQNDGKTFSPRLQLSDKGGHAYIASLGDGALAIWDEVYRDGNDFYNRVKMSLIADDEVRQIKFISPPGVEASMPYLLELKDGGVAAVWVQRNEGGNSIHFKKFTEGSL